MWSDPMSPSYPCNNVQTDNGILILEIWPEKFDFGVSFGPLDIIFLVNQHKLQQKIKPLLSRCLAETPLEMI